MKRYQYLAVALASALSLQGCVFVVAGAAAGAAAAVSVVNDRRPLQTITDDNNIEYNIASNIKQLYPDRTDIHITAAAFNHAVLLVGQVPSEQVREKIESTLQSWPKVTRIYNQLDISPPSSASTRTNDSWITAKVKAKLVEAPNLSSGQIKVITENGTTYLMGIVSRPQAQTAADAARRADGVKRVVTLFEYTLS